MAGLDLSSTIRSRTTTIRFIISLADLFDRIQTWKADTYSPAPAVKNILVHAAVVSWLEAWPEIVRARLGQRGDYHLSGERGELGPGRGIIPEEVPCRG